MPNEKAKAEKIYLGSGVYHEEYETFVGNIDVTKIPKDKLYKGEKGIYLTFKCSKLKEISEERRVIGQNATHSIYVMPEKSGSTKSDDDIPF